MRRPRVVPAIFGAVVLGAAAIAQVQTTFKPDSGKFILTARGMEIGTDAFKMDAQGGSESVMHLNVGDKIGDARISIKETKGHLKQIAADAGGGNRFVVNVAASGATLAIGDQPATPAELPINAIPTGNYSPHLMNNLIAAYNVKKGGTQTFSLVEAESVGAGGLTTLSAKLTPNGSEKATIGGKPVVLSRYKLVLTPGETSVDTELLADSNAHVVRWTVPSQGYDAVRAGYEAAAE